MIKLLILISLISCTPSSLVQSQFSTSQEYSREIKPLLILNVGQKRIFFENEFDGLLLSCEKSKEISLNTNGDIKDVNCPLSGIYTHSIKGFKDGDYVFEASYKNDIDSLLIFHFSVIKTNLDLETDSLTYFLNDEFELKLSCQEGLIAHFEGFEVDPRPLECSGNTMSFLTSFSSAGEKNLKVLVKNSVKGDFFSQKELKIYIKDMSSAPSNLLDAGIYTQGHFGPELIHKSDNFSSFYEGALIFDDCFIFHDLNSSKQYKKCESQSRFQEFSNTFQANGQVRWKDQIISAHAGDDKGLYMRSLDGDYVRINSESQELGSPNDVTLYSKNFKEFILFSDFSQGRVLSLNLETKEIAILSEIADANGLALNRSQSKLYVSSYFGNKIYSFDINLSLDNLVLSNKTEVTSIERPDGMICDSQDNLYVTYKFGVKVFDSKNSYYELGDLFEGFGFNSELFTNISFGGDEKDTLLITSKLEVFQIENMGIQGN